MQAKEAKVQAPPHREIYSNWWDPQHTGNTLCGNMGVAGNWTPAGGPSRALDDAFIGSNSPAGSAAVATISLGANQKVNDLRLGNIAGNTGIINLARFALTANNITISPFGGSGNVLHNGGRFTTVNLSVHNANALTLSANDVAANLSIPANRSC